MIANGFNQGAARTKCAITAIRTSDQTLEHQQTQAEAAGFPRGRDAPHLRPLRQSHVTSRLRQGAQGRWRAMPSAARVPAIKSQHVGTDGNR